MSRGEGTTFTVVLDIPEAERQLEEIRLDQIDALIDDDDDITLQTTVDEIEVLGSAAEQAHNGAEAIKMITGRHEIGG
ncbi:MAG: hypothetical protein K6F86_01955 [Lachnospiraceae bacterium]|nr:hypothetical protein [Lachnospiraceae bacterium]